MSHLKKISLFYKQLLLSNIIWIRKIIYWALIWFAIGLIIPLLFPDAARVLKRRKKLVAHERVGFFYQRIPGVGKDCTEAVGDADFHGDKASYRDL